MEGEEEGEVVRVVGEGKVEGLDERGEELGEGEQVGEDADGVQED